MSETVMLSFEQLRRDGGTQTRSWIDFTVVSDYAEGMSRGDVFPPGLAFYDGTDYWLVDGFHRAKAREEAGLEGLECIVQPGTQEEAQWASYGVNAHHGLRRSSADKRRAIEAALRHPKSKDMSDRAIAEHVGCDHKTVGSVRAQLFGSGEIPQSDTRVGRDGRAINVSGINAGRGESSQGTDGDGEDDGPQAPEGGWPKFDEDGVYDDDQAEVLPNVVGKRWCDIKVMQVEPPNLLWKQASWVSCWSIGCHPCVESQQLSRHEFHFDSREAAVTAAAIKLAVYCGAQIKSDNVPKTVKEILERFRLWAMEKGEVSESKYAKEIADHEQRATWRLQNELDDYVAAINSISEKPGEYSLARLAQYFLDQASADDDDKYWNGALARMDEAVTKLQAFIAVVKTVQAEREAAGVSE